MKTLISARTEPTVAAVMPMVPVVNEAMRFRPQGLQVLLADAVRCRPIGAEHGGVPQESEADGSGDDRARRDRVAWRGERLEVRGDRPPQVALEVVCDALVPVEFLATDRLDP